MLTLRLNKPIRISVASAISYTVDTLSNRVKQTPLFIISPISEVINILKDARRAYAPPPPHAHHAHAIASVEARTHAARGTSSAETHGRSLGRFFFSLAPLPKCIAPHAILLAVHALPYDACFLVSLHRANLPADLLGCGRHDLPAYFRELSQTVQIAIQLIWRLRGLGTPS